MAEGNPLLGGRKRGIMNNMVIMPRMRTIKQTAAELGLPEYFVRTLVKQEQIAYVRAGRKVLINLDKFIEYLNGATKAEGE